MQREKTSKPNNNRRKKLIIVMLSVVIAVGVPVWIVFDNYAGGPEYRAMKRQCRTKPVSGFTNIKRPLDKYYILPSSELYNAPTSMYDAYFCTEEEAIEAGYKKWMYGQ